MNFDPRDYGNEREPRDSRDRDDRDRDREDARVRPGRLRWWPGWWPTRVPATTAPSTQHHPKAPDRELPQSLSPRIIASSALSAGARWRSTTPRRSS